MQFKIFPKEIVQGVSETSFGSIKNPNRAIKFLKFLGYKKIKAKNLIWAEQIFNNKIHICQKKDGGKKIKGVDGLISNLPNQILVILSADCVPILIYDRENKVVAALHGARECLTKGILKNALKELREKFNSKSKNLLVGIGPHIRACHYWLREKIYQKLKKTKFKKYFLEKNRRVYFDLTKLVIDQLLKFGIKKGQIEDCKICTYCCAKRFFSYRKKKDDPKFYPEKKPRFASFIGLLKS